jgi:hypothetical protein
MRASTFLLAAVAVLALGTSAAVQPTYCNVTNSSGSIVADLFVLTPATYTGATLARHGVEVNVTVEMGWCAYQINSTACNASNVQMTLYSGTQCIEVFTGIFNTPTQLHQGVVQLQLWATLTTSIADVVIMCDTFVPKDTAVLGGYISYDAQVSRYAFKFYSPAACG